MKIFAIAAVFLFVAASIHAQGVSVRNLTPPGSFEVVNEGNEVSLSSRVQVQRLYNGTWHDVGADVRLACDVQPVPDCITLHRGERLRPPPWDGYSCSFKCIVGCRANAVYPPGTFRFLVASCAGDWSVAGSAFDMKEPVPLWKPSKSD